jgi:Spy/CpxP family protein refolding chaperone
MLHPLRIAALALLTACSVGTAAAPQPAPVAEPPPIGPTVKLPHRA